MAAVQRGFMSKPKRHENIDSRRLPQRIDLFRLGRAMLAEGYANDSQEMNEVALGLHRSLGLRPWQEFVLDFEIFTMEPPSDPSKAADFLLVQELHRRLVEATA
jgi:hypothetical protein